MKVISRVNSKKKRLNKMNKMRHGLYSGSYFWDHAAQAEKNHRLLFLFLRYSILDWAKGGRKDCEFVGIPKDFGISMKTLSHYS